MTVWALRVRRHPRTLTATRGKSIRCTYFLVTGLRVHLGCRSGAAAEGWSSRIGRGVGRVFGCSSVNSWGERERGGFGCFYPHLYMKLQGLLERDPCHFQPCLGLFIPAASKAPFTASTLGVGRSLGAPLLSLLLPCIQGLGSLSLPFPPPPLPTYDPTLRPHPSSLCQSGAAQPCGGAGAAGGPTLAGCRHACWQPGESRLQERTRL